MCTLTKMMRLPLVLSTSSAQTANLPLLTMISPARLPCDVDATEKREVL